MRPESLKEEELGGALRVVSGPSGEEERWMRKAVSLLTMSDHPMVMLVLRICSMARL